MELVTERLVIRDFRASDLEAVHAYAGDWDVCRYTDWGPDTIEETGRFLDGAKAASLTIPRTTYDLAIALQDGQLVGGAALVIDSVAHRRGRIGYVLRHDAWDRGYATEAARELIRFGTSLGLHRIEATCHPDNTGSTRVMQKAGMTYEGRMRDHLLVRGAWRDSLLYAFVGD
jgi:RimJ/RimL family protein N-acetyltransferase